MFSQKKQLNSNNKFLQTLTALSPRESCRHEILTPLLIAEVTADQRHMIDAEWELLPSTLQSRDTRERSQQCAEARGRSDSLTSSHRRHVQWDVPVSRPPPPPSFTRTYHYSLLLPWWVGLNVNSLLRLMSESVVWKGETFSSFLTGSLLIMISLKNRQEQI